MFSLEIVLLGIALAIDAAVVTFAVGLIHGEMDVASKVKRGFVICLTFGVFQAFMLWLGSYAGYLFSFSNYGFYLHHRTTRRRTPSRPQSLASMTAAALIRTMVPQWLCCCMM